MPEDGDDPTADLIVDVVAGVEGTDTSQHDADAAVAALARTVGALAPRRRQALLMLLYALTDGGLDTDGARTWLAAHDTDDDAGLTQMIGWLRHYRPHDPDGTG